MKHTPIYDRMWFYQKVCFMLEFKDEIAAGDIWLQKADKLHADLVAFRLKKENYEVKTVKRVLTVLLSCSGVVTFILALLIYLISQ